MTYRNDPYDPKQAALLDPAALDDAVAEAEKAFAAAADLDALARRQATAPRRPVAGVAGPPRDRRAAAGREVRRRQAGQRGPQPRSRPPYDARAAPSWRPSGPRGCWSRSASTSPCRWDRRPRGARHPLTTLMERIGDLFVGMGYEIAEGPEVELEWANFDALNIRAGPPGARADGHVLRRTPRGGAAGSGLVLRTHTSPGAGAHDADPQAADLRGRARAGLPHRRAGRHPHARSSTRSRAWSWTRASRWRTCAGTLDHFARAMFGPEARTRWRPHYFPFTEPSAEFDVWFPQHRDGPRWVEWGGCGMVNPRVLRGLRHRPGGLLRVRVRHGHRAHADVPPRRQRHAGHGRGRRAVHPRVRDGGLSR